MPNPVPFSETPYIPEYKQLAAIVGKGKLRADLWDSWGLIVAKHGWKRVLRAANALEPDERWPAQTERLCNRYADEAKQEAREAEQRAREASRPKVADRKGMGEMFRSVRERYGV